MAFFVLLGGLQFGYTLVYYGPCINILNAQLDWTGSKGKIYSAIITSIPQVGLAIGSFSAPAISIKVGGKRKALIYANMIGSVGVAITLFKHLYTFLLGRLIYGFSIGIIQAIAPRFLLSTVPSETTSTFGPIINLVINSGIFLGNVMALIIPTDSDSDYLTSNSWRYLFALPFVF